MKNRPAHNLRNPPTWNPRIGDKGSALVEVLVACLIIAIIVIAGAEYIFKTHAILAIQENRRMALMAANNRLEDVRALAYTNMTRLISLNASTNFIRRNAVSGIFVIGSNETVNIGGTLFPITTTIQYVDADGLNPPYDCLRVTASVGYRNNSSDQVRVQTLRSPYNDIFQ